MPRKAQLAHSVVEHVAYPQNTQQALVAAVVVVVDDVDGIHEEHLPHHRSYSPNRLAHRLSSQRCLLQTHPRVELDV